MYIRDIRTISGKNVPFEMEMSDKMRRNSKTIFRILFIEINVRLDESIFDLGALSW